MIATLRKIFGSKSDQIELGTITVLYGGKSGNAEFVAKETYRHLKSKGEKIRIKNMSSYKAANLSQEETVLAVVSTHGEGDPPPAATRFFRQLKSGELDLSSLKFAVCALGDSDYEDFCQAGKDLEQLLMAAGAEPFLERVDCDAAFEKAAGDWIGAVSQKLTNSSEDGAGLELDANKDREFQEGVILAKKQLNADLDVPVYHIAINCPGKGFSYLPGDSIGIIPRNSTDLVHQILEQLKLKGEAPIGESDDLSLRSFLLKRAELTNLNKSLLVRYQQLANDENLADLLRDEEACLSYVAENDLLDLITDFPAQITTNQLVQLLDKLKARYYSIASFEKSNPGELHLTVKQVSFERNQRNRQGACSNFLGRSLEVGSPVSYFLSEDASFRLPERSSTPCIFIAAGTGIAPVRAFLQQRAYEGADRNWLFFGAKQRQNDFLYQDEIEAYQKQGVLPQLDLAFSRDQEAKIYVQDLLLKNAPELLQWLKDGAHIYVCGSIAMGKAVREAFSELLESNSEKQGIQQLLNEKRFHEDVY